MSKETEFDFTILTDHRWIDPISMDDYTSNVLTEDRLVQEAIEKQGFKVNRKSWDDEDFNWESTKNIIFRTTWDYFDRFNELSKWLLDVQYKTNLINPRELILWNIDKHYLGDLELKGIPIPPTQYIEKGDKRTLEEIATSTTWKKFILKPVISGAARHTYLFDIHEIDRIEPIFKELIGNESMMLQEFQKNILEKGEIALILFGGKYSHCVLKKAKQGDFRVQDDFGGTLHDYTPSEEEIALAEECVYACPTLPLYARVDIMWDNQNNPIIGELELIEPELWFRRDEEAATRFADVIQQHYQSQALS